MALAQPRHLNVPHARDFHASKNGKTFTNISGIADICLQEVFIRYKEQWSSEALFWIWNTKGFAANEGLHILIPFALSVPTAGSRNSSSIGKFYVHKPDILVPRRPARQPSKIIFVQEYVKGPDSLKTKNRKGNLELEKELGLRESNGKKMLPKKEIETRREEIILSIPNLCDQENVFPSILYCKVHQSCRVAHLKKDS